MNSINLFKTSIITVIAILSYAISSVAQKPQPVDFVNPYIGNISHLLVPTFPTIHLPNSMLRVCPERADYTSEKLNGLPIVLTSHRGSTAFNFSPFQGDEKELRPIINYSFDNERITPYSYSVYLDEQETVVDFGVSHQSAMYKVDFKQDKPVFLIFNSKIGELFWNGKTLSGFQNLSENTKVYIYVEFQTIPTEIYSINNEGVITDKKSISSNNASFALKFPKGEKSITLKYGISFIDTAQAAKNLKREITDWNLANLQAKGRQIWNDALSKIEVSSSDTNHQTVFYTSLYRTYERPVAISEDGRYFSGFDGKVHSDNGITFYNDDWIWDTYRAHHPLRILIDAEKESNILHSEIEMAAQMEHFWMPTFPGITGDGRLMNSNHGVASILDAYRKGLKGFDLANAYQACKGAIMEKTLSPWSGKPAGKLDKFYHERGYMPTLKVGEKETNPEVHSFEARQPVAVTLGTAYDQWCLSEIAKVLDYKEDSIYFGKCSFNYRNIFNPKTGFFHPKDSDGKFIEPFDYRFSGGMGARQYYDENNGWIYRWDVQHNIPDLIALMGGNEAFINNLDKMFETKLGKSKYEFYAQLPDHTGNVGQFSMANEPSLHIPYLYNYAGAPWKTQKRIRQLIDQWFRNDLMGIPGDEDGGGLTSFVVFSMIGFYPVTPGLPVYSIGSPMFEKAEVKLSNGKIFSIIAKNCSSENKYIQSATLNGKPWNKSWISHTDIVEGAQLELIMGNTANQKWGVE